MGALDAGASSGELTLLRGPPCGPPPAPGATASCSALTTGPPVASSPLARGCRTGLSATPSEGIRSRDRALGDASARSSNIDAMALAAQSDAFCTGDVLVGQGAR